MPDEQTIQPALTPEEWTFPHHAMWMSPKMGILAHVRVESEHEDGSVPMLLSIRTPQAVCHGWDGKTLTLHEADDRHALAALCLYGQPFGFTQRMMRLCEMAGAELAQQQKWQGRKWVCDADEVSPAEYEQMAQIIAALLPPSP